MKPFDVRKTFTGVWYNFPDFRPTCVRMPKPGSQPANSPVIRFVTAMLIFASHRLRNRIMRTPEAAMAMIMMAPTLTAYGSLRPVFALYIVCTRPQQEKDARQVSARSTQQYAWRHRDTLSKYVVDLARLLREIASKLPTYPNVPATLFGRLALNEAFRGQKLGEFLLLDALHRSWVQSKQVASAAVIVDAKDESEGHFYEQFFGASENLRRSTFQE